MKITSIVGARPQFIKSAPVSMAIRRAGLNEYIVHTGQHYDYGMSNIFFEELNIPEPDINLGIGSGTHAFQTGQMLIEIETILLSQQPDCVLVYGDTNSTFAGALAAAKLQIPIAHVEAGLRSYNRAMPEEHNRILTDHCADLLFCPTKASVQNLVREGITQNVFMVGDTMVDAVLKFAEIAWDRSKILAQLELTPKHYILATVHRAYNTDEPSKLNDIISAFREIADTIVFPAHPRTRVALQNHNILLPKNVMMVDPVGYLDMIVLEKNSRLILTDSGGIQKEAYFFAVPCITLRSETEWIETIQSGWNLLGGTDPNLITSLVRDHIWPDKLPEPVFGNGHAAERIVTEISAWLYHKESQIKASHK